MSGMGRTALLIGVTFAGIFIGHSLVRGVLGGFKKKPEPV